MDASRWFPTFVYARIGPDGKCGIKFFAPFTRSDGEIYIGLRDDERISVGFSNMAGAALAARHFNSRNPTLIPEFANISDCNVTLSIDTVYDTQSLAEPSCRALLEDMVAEEDPLSTTCALAGSYHDRVAKAHSVLAYSSKVPLVVTRSLSLDVVKDDRSPFSSSVYPDSFGSASFVIRNLLFMNRTSYIALIYPLSDLGLQRRAALGVLLDSNQMVWMSSEFLNEGDDIAHDTSSANATASRSIRWSVQRVKQTGYRTIVLAVDRPRESIPLLADAFEEFGMLNGDHLIYFYDEFEFDLLNIKNNSNITRLLYGSAHIIPISRDFLGEDGISAEQNPNPISLKWHNMGQDFADELNLLNPIKEHEKGYIHVNGSFFSSGVLLDYGAAFAYDSVMAVGMGACAAAKDLDGSTSGTAHQNGIRKTTFLGASGVVRFGSPTLQRGGVRDARKLTWSMVNLIHKEPHFHVPYYAEPSDGEWKQTQQKIAYVYADGTNVAPKLRDDPEQNYLSNRVRIAGLSLMGISMGLVAALGVWVIICRKHRILAAAQPLFLAFILLGAFIQISSVVTISFDESYGLTDSQLSRLCMAFPWLFCIGTVVVDSALFTKLWRIHRVLQFSRRRVGIKSVLWPMAMFCGLTLLLLSLWTLLAPLSWSRTEINSTTGESIGECETDDHTAAFAIPTFGVIVIIGVLMIYMAWKTRDVDGAYSEANWIFILLLVQAEVLLVAAPVAVRLSGEDPSTTYLAYTGIILSFPWTTVGLIIGPKLWAYYVAVRGLESRNPKRGQRATSARVTGLTVPTTRRETFGSSRETTASSCALPTNAAGTQTVETIPEHEREDESEIVG